jgi:tetratricopeptide (TPR) repeat protein
VTYNGRGFDWPLLVTRYRMARRDPPVHAGHLDLLPFVRRVFRHRMVDARLRTVETELLGIERHEDVEGWQIPGRYLDFLRLGIVEPLIEVIRHNREDVRSLARLLADVETRFAAVSALGEADPGDLAGLARAYAREGRLDDALACLDAATSRHGAGAPVPDDEVWWQPRHPVDYGGRPTRLATAFGPPRVDSPWTEDRVLVERARILRRLGRYTDAAAVWEAIGAGAGPMSAHAWIEVAKLREHRLHDLAGAFAAAERARTVIERRRRLGRFDPALDHALAGRLARLGRRLDARRAAAAVVAKTA